MTSATFAKLAKSANTTASERLRSLGERPTVYKPTKTGSGALKWGEQKK